MSDAILRTLGAAVHHAEESVEWVTAAQAKYAVDFNLAGIISAWRQASCLPAAALMALALGGTRRAVSWRPVHPVSGRRRPPSRD